MMHPCGRRSRTPRREAIMESNEPDAGRPAADAPGPAIASARTPTEPQHVLQSRPAVSDRGEIDPGVVAFNVFAKLMETDGIRAALYSVLRKSDYRFIGIFRFKDGKATSAVHVDRQNLNVTQADEVDATATYCNFVRHSGKPFITADAVTDPSTDGHVAREVIRSYCGVPILDSEGAFVGTLCHYDLVPRDPHQLNLEFLVQVSGALSRSGLIPPYPQPC